MIFFPWDENQHYLEDEHAFDHAPYYRMVEQVDAEVILWTRTKAKEFCLEHYPEIWEILEEYAARPIMVVDIFRWLCVYHYGGIYWQYGSLMLGALEEYLPSPGQKVRFYRYDRIFFYVTHNGVLQRLTKKNIHFPNTLVKGVSPALFSASEPKVELLLQLVLFLVERLQKEKVGRDKDIIYITGNQAVSEFYHLFGQGAELAPLSTTNRLVKFNSMGSWRTDAH